MKFILLLLLPMALFAETNVQPLDPLQVRQKMNQKMLAIEATTPEVAEVLNTKVPFQGHSIPIRFYSPNSDPNLPAALFIHGGGWVGGNLDTHDNLARYLCKEAGVVVVSVGYTNSPEGKFPLPLEECYAVLLWMKENAQKLSIDPSHIMVVGDSAGGNMAAALTLLSRDRKGPCISLQVLINPATNLAREDQAQSKREEVMRWIATQYVSKPEDLNNPYASPFLAQDLHNLPPAVVILAENDELRGDGQRYADRLSAAGIPTSVYLQRNIGHLGSDGARASPKALESLNVAAQALRQGSNFCSKQSQASH